MLQLSNISKHYGDVLVLADVSFTLNNGDRMGLIGPNGCGKTTLLRIVMGAEAPDGGAVRIQPESVRVGYLEQGSSYPAGSTLDDVLRTEQRRLDALEARVADLGAVLSATSGEVQAKALEEYGEVLAELESLAATLPPEHQLEAVLDGLGLGDMPLDTPVAHLSGGQKTRLGLACLLVQNPQILLLDEPTNHLDIAALEWLEDWLRGYSGAVLLVSHDRTFLDRTVTTILDLDPLMHRLTVYPGNYSDYLTTKQRELERHWAAYNAQQEHVAQLLGEARRLTGYANSIEAGTIDFGPRAIAKGIARRATVQRHRIERELETERIEKPRLNWHMKLEFVDTPESGQEVLLLKDLAAGYNGVPLFSGVNQTLRQGERVALIGPNGAGKTTLLRVITGKLAPLAGSVRLGSRVKLGYYAQEQETLDPHSTPFEVVRAAAAMSDTDVRSFLHYFLFAGDDVFTPVGSLSYGERARLVLARLVATGCNFLLLDEPINHLDIPSRAGFEQAMSAFEGTVLAVVHDRYFIEHFATQVWSVAGGTVKRYVDLEDYQRGRRVAMATVRR
ncbi:MAG: ABC-F family ATP-binding cassette domain-containing protein [Anaerolineae bacterium]|nr:ABC-F family ATP-binding cassette domain-containing protein [Anaerolineae bacterium]